MFNLSSSNVAISNQTAWIDYAASHGVCLEQHEYDNTVQQLAELRATLHILEVKLPKVKPS